MNKLPTFFLLCAVLVATTVATPLAGPEEAREVPAPGVSPRGDYVIIESRLYFLSSENVTWSRGQASCHLLDMRLANVWDQPTHDSISNFLAAHENYISTLYWLGAMRPAFSSDWYWTEPMLTPMFESFWAPGYPTVSTFTDHCVAFRASDQGWSDFDCTTLRNYMCEQGM